jgi:hypothetical protein
MYIEGVGHISKCQGHALPVAVRGDTSCEGVRVARKATTSTNTNTNSSRSGSHNDNWTCDYRSFVCVHISWIFPSVHMDKKHQLPQQTDRISVRPLWRDFKTLYEAFEISEENENQQ